MLADLKMSFAMTFSKSCPSGPSAATASTQAGTPVATWSPVTTVPRNFGWKPTLRAAPTGTLRSIGGVSRRSLFKWLHGGKRFWMIWRELYSVHGCHYFRRRLWDFKILILLFILWDCRKIIILWDYSRILWDSISMLRDCRKVRRDYRKIRWEFLRIIQLWDFLRITQLWDFLRIRVLWDYRKIRYNSRTNQF